MIFGSGDYCIIPVMLIWSVLVALLSSMCAGLVGVIVGFGVFLTPTLFFLWYMLRKKDQKK